MWSQDKDDLKRYAFRLNMIQIEDDNKEGKFTIEDETEIKRIISLESWKLFRPETDKKWMILHITETI